MSKITKSANGKRCTMRLNNVCNGDPSTTIWAHIRSIRYGAGKGIKPPDLIGLYACHDCHSALDKRTRKDKTGKLLDYEFVKLRAMEGHLESLMILWEEGII